MEYYDRDLKKKATIVDLAIRIWIVVVALFLVSNFALNTYTVIKIQDTTQAIKASQEEGSPVGRRILELSQTIKGCVEVEGECYKDRVKNNNGSTNTILSAMAATISCMDEVPDREFKGLRECVFKTLDREMPNE